MYAQPNGALTIRARCSDSLDRSAGNALELTYDASLRLVAISDAIGQVTTLSYELPGDPLKITASPIPSAVTRRSSTTPPAAVRITDVIGIQSSFEYGPGDFIKSLATPYGTTTFRTAEAGRFRWLEATDPLGGTERLEYVNDVSDALPGAEYTTYFPDGLPVNEVPTGFYWAGSPWGTSYYWYRNTFFWSKRLTPWPPGDHTAAKLIHWKHTANMMQTRVIENEKEPLETMRTFYKYPNQASTLSWVPTPHPQGSGA
jgi:YD repeat-containing protein